MRSTIRAQAQLSSRSGPPPERQPDRDEQAESARSGRSSDSIAARLGISLPFEARQAINAAELPGIRGDDRRSEPAGMRRDQQIERADDGTSLLQIHADFAVVTRRIEILWQHVEEAHKGLNRFPLRGGMGGPANAHFQLRDRDDGQGTLRDFRQPALRRPTPEQRHADRGIQQVEHRLMSVEAQIPRLLIDRLFAVRKILRFRKVLLHVAGDIRESPELGFFLRLQDNLVSATFDLHFRAFEAELLGKPDRLTATMLEELRGCHRYIV